MFVICQQNGDTQEKNDFFYAVRIASMNQAAERTAAMLKRIPGALLQPNIATKAKNATAEIMMIDDCMTWCWLPGMEPGGVVRQTILRRLDPLVSRKFLMWSNYG